MYVVHAERPSFSSQSDVCLSGSRRTKNATEPTSFMTTFKIHHTTPTVWWGGRKEGMVAWFGAKNCPVRRAHSVMRFSSVLKNAFSTFAGGSVAAVAACGGTEPLS